ncbi:MAG: TerC/Alx family metal homeostasis membrane protein [Bacteroidales bacterium]|nr:TerC/Alx family metal homeostasis membrane protein [Bacteroidales bacterium]
MITRYLFFIVFIIFIVVMLSLDLGVFHKKDHVIGIREAAMWTGIWVLLALGMGALLLFRAEWVHGIGDMEGLLAYAKGQPGLLAAIQEAGSFEAALSIYRREVAEQYLAGYFLEESLSIDNIFVMIMIFVSFGIDKRYYHRVLFWGVLGAIIMRFLFIFAVGALVTRLSWILAVFGVILIFSGIKMFRDKGDEKINTEEHPMVRFASKHFRVSPQMDGHNFFSTIDGKRYMTPLFLVLLVIEFSDVIFAVDSIPAVFSVTTDSYIVYFSNIFAIMGLRSLFFLLSDVADRFWLLRYGLGVLLCFIGVKMIAGEFFGLHISTMVSLGVILGILFGSVVLSMAIKKTENGKRKTEN